MTTAITESQQRLLLSIRDHDGDVWEGWRLWASTRRVNPGGAESAFGAIMRKGWAEPHPHAPNVYRITPAGWRALGPQVCRHCVQPITMGDDDQWRDDRPHPESCYRARDFKHVPESEADLFARRERERTARREARRA